MSLSPASLTRVIISALPLFVFACATTSNNYASHPSRADKAAADKAPADATTVAHNPTKPLKRDAKLGDQRPADAKLDGIGTIGTVRYIRTVSMFYKLDLHQDNNHATEVAASMNANDAKIRSCYMTRLDREPTAQGDVVFNFDLSRATGLMQHITKVRSTAPDLLFEKCLEARLSAVPFHPITDMHGTVVYSFASKTKILGAPAQHLAQQK